MNMRRFNIDYYDRVMIGYFAIFALIMILVVVTCNAANNKAIDEYNNGTCRECGGHYEFLQAVGHQACTDYIYICNGCRRSLELPKYM